MFQLLLVSCCVLRAAGAVDGVPPAVSATYKIANKDSTATCFVIERAAKEGEKRRERFLVTSAHVLERMTGDGCRFVARHEQADGDFLRKEVPLKIRADDKPLWVRHPDVDVAVLKLEFPDDANVSALEFERLAGEAAIKDGALKTGGEVWIPCFPAKLESSSAGFPVLRRGAVASFPLTPVDRYRTFLVDYSTFGGDSGAAVFVRPREDADGPQRPIVVGLVIGQHRETTRSTTPIEERTVHRSMGLAIVVHAEFVRQTIERAGGD